MSIWKRNILFGSLCFLGMSALASNLLPKKDQASEPGEYSAFSDPGFVKTIARVNREFAASWDEQGISPANSADHLTIIRRTSLALVGTIPSVEDIRSIERLPENERLMWWVNRLLDDHRCADYLSERFARAFVGTEDGPFLIFRRRRFTSWLSDQFHQNRPYDELVSELISGEGLWTDSPCVNFLTVTTDVNGDEQPDAQRLAARTSRAFLGVRLDCVQCHDDNLGGDWLQSDFHQLASFYAEAQNSLLGVADEEGEEYEYQYLGTDEPEIVEPSVPFHKEVPTEGSNRRRQLAHWVTHSKNKAFSRAIVNRMWALMFGKPILAPVDDIPLSGPYPPGLELLADDFSKHGFDLHRLIRQIIFTDVFQLSSRHAQATGSHEDAWALFPITRLRPEQVARSIVQAGSLTTTDSESHILLQISWFDDANGFVRRFGDSGEDEFGAEGGTIPQRLLMMNGDLVRARTEEELVLNASTRIAALAHDNETAIKTAYLGVVSRQPSDVELAHFNRQLESDENDIDELIEDLFWILLNSTEFSWNH